MNRRSLNSIYNISLASRSVTICFPATRYTEGIIWTLLAGQTRILVSKFKRTPEYGNNSTWRGLRLVWTHSGIYGSRELSETRISFLSISEKHSPPFQLKTSLCPMIMYQAHTEDKYVSREPLCNRSTANHFAWYLPTCQPESRTAIRR
jgi:hypothetical protein